MWYGTSMKRAGQCCRTVCVVWRRSFERCMPPCSAIERRRLITRHTVRYGANHEMKYTHGWPSAIDRDEHELHPDDAPGLRAARGPEMRTPRTRPLKSFQPVWPVASRVSLRRIESLAIG